MVYHSRIREWRTRRLQLKKWAPKFLRGRSISFSFALRYTVDTPGLPPSASTSGEYVYDRLDESRQQIRLLCIHPGKPGEVVSASLITVDLESAPPYEALSYAWGFTSATSMLLDKASVQVNQGAFDAILALRRSDYIRIIWCDTLSINQADQGERSSQVAIMDKIYENAACVTVYLGHHTPQTPDAMRALQYFINPTTTAAEPPWSHLPTPHMQQIIKDVIERRWFTRVWTVQEITLARRTNFVCGAHEVSWSCDTKTLRSIVFRIKAAAVAPYYDADTENSLDWGPLLQILETQLRQAARRENITLLRNQLDLAYDYRLRQSSDRRDKYYAIMNIIENDQGANLKLAPDYNEPLEDLHRRFTAEIQQIAELEGVYGWGPVSRKQRGRRMRKGGYLEVLKEEEVDD